MRDPASRVLCALHEAREPLSLLHLGERTGLDHTTLARHLTELVRDGTVSREIRKGWNKPGNTKGGKYLYVEKAA